jgi:hypothetical protein
MRRLIFACLVFLTLFPVFSQEIEAVPIFAFDQRSLGDRALNLSLGTVIPLFYQDLNSNVSSANLSLGGVLALDLDFYLTNNWLLGGRIRGSFQATPNGNLLFTVPILVKGTYEIKFWPFSVPLWLGAGLSFVSFKQALEVNPTLQLGSGFYYHMSSQWGFGLNLNYLWIAQLYFQSDSHSIPWSHSRLGNFLDVGLSAVFHF